MSERPIHFNGEMVRAIFEGRKTQTRRIAKLTKNGMLKLRSPYATPLTDKGPVWTPFAGSKVMPMQGRDLGENCPYGQIGDRLWVREAHAYVFRGKSEKSLYGPDYGIHCEHTEDGHFVVEYAADPDLVWDWEGGWRPSIHMPRWASRMNLEITDIRVERLQTISNEDARAESCEGHRASDGYDIDPFNDVEPRDEFAELWIKTYGQVSFDSDPWVWVIEFKPVNS